MKPVYSREHYIRNWDRYIKRVPGDNYINLAEELERAMSTYQSAELDDKALRIIEKIEAQKIAERANILVHKQMEVVKRVEAGNSSFGYTTQSQEYEARAEYRTRFEFNCLQLAMFRKQHGV